MTVSNPTQCGFEYPKDLFLSLNNPLASSYEPDPFGNMRAREAVLAYLSSKGHQVDPSNLLLTASTSEAYSYIFKLLGNPGDSFLTPAPGYPLLDHLLRLEGLEPLPYPLLPKLDWPVDHEETEKQIQPRTKGLIVVNPHNPTGCFLSSTEQSDLLKFCLNRHLAYISDEVFSDFAYPGHGLAGNPTTEVLSFRLGGLSKSLGLPQLKLSWIAMDGPKDTLAECQGKAGIDRRYLFIGQHTRPTGVGGLVSFCSPVPKTSIGQGFRKSFGVRGGFQGFFGH